MALPSPPVFGILYHAETCQSSEGDRHPDDWTGISSPALRRKIQNRLNQRASRNRRSETACGESHLFHEDNGHYFVEAMNVPRLMKLENSPMANKSSFKSTTMIDQHRIKKKASFNSTHMFPLAISSQPSATCIAPSDRHSITSASDFVSWITPQSNDQGYDRGFPLSADHLLTLVRFNLVRALTANIITIGVDPDLMSLDITSPFFSSTYGPSAPKDPLCLPWYLQPTDLQRRITHHPFIDVFPSSRIRDNLLRAGDSYDMDELCNDILGIGVLSSSGTNASEEHQTHIPTGLLVWGEPWHPGSWEVTGDFATKWSWVLLGCTELLDSTNYWRNVRGEERLVLEVESTT